MGTNVFAFSESCREHIPRNVFDRYAVICESLDVNATLMIPREKLHEMLIDGGDTIAYSTTKNNIAIVQGVILRLKDPDYTSPRGENAAITRLYGLLRNDGIRTWDSVENRELRSVVAQLKAQVAHFERRIEDLSRQVKETKQDLRNALRRERTAKQNLVPTENNLPKWSENYDRPMRYEERVRTYFRDAQVSQKEAIVQNLEKLGARGQNATGLQTKKFWKELPGIPEAKGAWDSRASGRLRFLWLLNQDAVKVIALGDKGSNQFGR